MFKFVFYDGTSYQVYEDDLDRARLKLAKALLQLNLDQYVWKKRGQRIPPTDAIKISKNIYLRKHTVEEI